MWTDELIARLAQYVSAGRYYQVTHEGSQVALVEPRYHEDGESEPASFYYGDSAYGEEVASSAEPHNLEECQPTDFKVLRLDEVDWVNTEYKP